MKNFYVVDLNRNMVVHIDETLLLEAQKLSSAKEDKSNNKDILRGNESSKATIESGLRLKLSRFSPPISIEQIASVISDANHLYDLERIRFYSSLYYALYLDQDRTGFTKVDLKNREFNRLELIRSLRLAIDFRQLVA